MFGNWEGDRARSEAGLEPRQLRSHTYEGFDGSPKFPSNFPHCGDCGEKSREKRGEEGYTGVYKGGVYGDDDVDNQNARQRHEEEEFLTLGAPMFAFLIG